MNYKYLSRSDNDTITLAENIESEKFPNMVIVLNGELGSGKTLFTGAFAKAMEVEETISSPTFNIIKEYHSGELPLYHIDVYRLDGNVKGFDLNEYYNNGGVTIIEWGDTITDYLPSEYLEIIFNVASENKRLIYLRPHGSQYEEICEAVI